MSKIQVTTENYNFSSYATRERWLSYRFQISLVLEKQPKSVLVIGVGDSIVVDILKKFIPKVETFDFDPELKPDICGDIVDIENLVSEKYDVIVCCQVLEHLPYSNFKPVLNQIYNLTDTLIMSLPYGHLRFFDIKIKLPKFPRFSLSLIVPKFLENYKFNGQHYWEVGTKGYSKSKVYRDMKEVFSTVEYKKFDDFYYHLFIECNKSNRG